MKSSQLAVAKIEVVRQKNGRAYTVIEVPSDSNPNKVYRVDLVNVRCSCPAWIFQKGPRKLCKHLTRLGFTAAQANPAPAQVKQMELIDGVQYL